MRTSAVDSSAAPSDKPAMAVVCVPCKCVPAAARAALTCCAAATCLGFSSAAASAACEPRARGGGVERRVAHHVLHAERGRGRREGKGRGRGERIKGRAARSILSCSVKETTDLCYLGTAAAAGAAHGARDVSRGVGLGRRCADAKAACRRCCAEAKAACCRCAEVEANRRCTEDRAACRRCADARAACRRISAEDRAICRCCAED